MKLQAGSIIENKQSILEVIEKQGQLCIKKTAKTGGESDVIAQVYMLRNLPENLARHYPKLMEWEVSTEPYWYLMSFCEYPTLRELLFFSNVQADVLQDKLNRVIQFLFYQHYQWKQQPADQNYISRVYEHRMRKRLDSLRVYDTLFEQVLLANALVINERPLQSPLKILDRILADKNLLHALRPKSLCSIHGQMEFDHILVGTEERFSDDFVLLDPRGIGQLGDTAYDVGKIWQSSRTKVDLLEEELYELDYQLEENVLIFHKFSLSSSNRLPVSQTIYEAARASIKSIMEDTHDEHLLMRSDFAEAVHLCSAVPYYYEGRNKLRRALACYLLGAVAINNFADTYL